MQEDLLLKYVGAFKQSAQVFQGKQPFVEKCIQLADAFSEFRHFKIDVGEFVVKDFLRPRVHELHFVVHVFGVVLAEAEVEDSDGVDLAQAEVPLAFRSLFLDGESGIVDASVDEVFLFGLLHLDEELFATVVFAIDIEDGLSLGGGCPHVLDVEVVQVGDDLASGEERVEKADEQVFVHLCAEELLESEVCVEVDVTLVAAGHVGINVLLESFFHGDSCFDLAAKIMKFMQLDEMFEGFFIIWNKFTNTKSVKQVSIIINFLILHFNLKNLPSDD